MLWFDSEPLGRNKTRPLSVSPDDVSVSEKRSVDDLGIFHS